MFDLTITLGLPPTALFLAPLIGISSFSWILWLLKSSIASRYHPIPRNDFHASVSLVIPVYHEDPSLFHSVLHSFVRSKPDEIIAVIDQGDQLCIDVFKAFQKKYPKATLLITKKPGKRQALYDGFHASRGDIVIFVDSDTLWADDILPDLLAPFIDPQVGGVAVLPHFAHRSALVQAFYALKFRAWSYQYVFPSFLWDAIPCIPGETAAYRGTALKSIINGLIVEQYMGKLWMTGDDHYLTRSLKAQGWQIRFQGNVHVETMGASSIFSYLQQQVRWSRDGLLALGSRIKPAHFAQRVREIFLYAITYRLQVELALSELGFLSATLLLRMWLAAGLLLVWIFISYTLRLWSAIWERPALIFLMPFFVLHEYALTLIRLYALFTLRTDQWLTRKAQKNVSRPIISLPGFLPFLLTGGTLLVLILMLLIYAQVVGLTGENTLMR